MSLHAGVVAIEGDHINRAAEILAALNAEVDPNPIITASRGRLNRDIAMAVYQAGNWTAILDAEIVLSVETDAAKALSTRLATRVLILVCEGVSGTYQLTLFDRGQTVRDFLLVDGQIQTNEGALPAENGRLNANTFEDDIIDVAESIGFDYWTHEHAQHFVVFKYPETEPAAAPSPAASPPARPWWKFW